MISKVEFPSDDRVRLTVTCPECLEKSELEVGAAAYAVWIGGRGLIQEIFPELKAADRERLQTGICPRCWDELFKDDR